MKDLGHIPARGWYRDADGPDLEQDSQWDQVDPGMYGTDPTLEDWPRPYRSFLSPVRREDFDPAGLPKLPPTRSDCPGVVLGSAARGAVTHGTRPASPSVPAGSIPLS